MDHVIFANTIPSFTAGSFTSFVEKVLGHSEAECTIILFKSFMTGSLHLILIMIIIIIIIIF